MENVKKKLLALLAAIALAIGGWATGDKLGGATPGTPSHIATTSLITLGPDEEWLIFSQTNTCSARIITTESSNIRLGFGTSTYAASTTVTNATGHLQPASTTVAYDSELYGCGYVVGQANATTSIRVTQLR